MPTWSIPSSAAWSDGPRRLTAAALAAAGLLGACQAPPPGFDSEVLVIGAGIAGLAAALEASAAGAQVTVVDMNSVGGGHAVMAGGLFLVGTPLQAEKGVADSVELAVADMLAWGEDADESWVRRYVKDSRTEIHDWLTAMGVEFALLMPAPGETSVPRFHFTRGTSVNVVVPMMHTAFGREDIRWHFNSRAMALRRLAPDGWEVDVESLRTREVKTLRARTVVVATGGFESDLARVRSHWLPDTAQPERLLAGAGRFAKGAGLDLGAAAGAALARLDHQTIFVTGLPDPRDPRGEHGLLAMNPAAIHVDANGRRFMNESVPRKTLETTVLALPGQSYWLIFDDRGRRRLQVRGAPWLTRDTLEREILGNPAIVQRADGIPALAAAAGLPPAALARTVADYNAALAGNGADPFGRFGGNADARRPPPIGEPPFYAMRLYPMTRKSMGGLVIDDDARVLDEAGQPLPGLYAAGEVTGVAGINGSHGGSGTFLGPSVYTGRIAGRSAAAAARSVGGAGKSPASADEPGAEQHQSASRGIGSPSRTGAKSVNSGSPGGKAAASLLDTELSAAALESLLATPRPGYWHFERTHALVREKGWGCGKCHDARWPIRSANTADEKRAQLESCARCH